jgi:hypothetical protein
MSRTWLGLLILTGCGGFQSRPEPQIRVDTVTVTQTVEPPLPEGRPAEICLSTGVTAQIHIAANGDTLIGEKRVRLSELRPALTFPGVYAGERAWFVRADVISFERSRYRRAGVDRARACDELKLVGEHDGVPVFAEVTAPQLLPMIVIPVRPGVYQDYLRVR